MSEPYYIDEQVTLWHGDALAVLRTLPDGSVDSCVTSPPYFGLRDYGVEGQMGAESSPAEYVEGMRALFAEVRRVLADDGTLWLNLGDSYSATLTRSGTATPSKTLGLRSDGTDSLGNAGRARAQARQRMGEPRSLLPGVGPKNLLGIPWRTAFALQDDGWTLRNEIIWAKPNGMPESVTDRLASKHEHLFLFAKSRRYHFDLDAIREPHSTATVARLAAGPVAIARRTPGEKRDANIYGAAAGTNLTATGERHTSGDPMGKNPGDVWSIPTTPFTGAHFAVMPMTLAERCILAGCKPGGTVLDPFSGSGTTGLAAARHGRRYVGIDLNADYLKLSLETRLQQATLDFGGVA
jgi:DNA modification methylase